MLKDRIEQQTIAIWGIGKRLQNELKNINLFQVCCFIDSNAACDKISGIPVIPPDRINEYSYDYIVISSNLYFAEIVDKCIYELGIDFSKIIRLSCYLDYLTSSQGDAYYNYYQTKINSYPKIPNMSTKKLIKEVDNKKRNELFNFQGTVYSAKKCKKKISIYQVSHKEFSPIKEACYCPLGVGNKSDDLPYKSTNTGVNINKFNAVINECTAIYWIWKNTNDEYVGINHYRRVFESDLNEGWPVQKYELGRLLEYYDIIVAQPYFSVKESIQEQLCRTVCEEAYEKSRKVVDDIFEKKSEPEKKALITVLNGGMMYPCNMFVMRREIFESYCTWLFDILFEMIEKIEIKKEWDNYSKRIIGFWAERFLTVWLYTQDLNIYDMKIYMIGDKTPFGIDREG